MYIESKILKITVAFDVRVVCRRGRKKLIITFDIYIIIFNAIRIL